MAKKQMIMDNALELFAKQGFEATSIQQITEKCGISKGAFYLSFKSKDELIFSLLDQFLDNLLHNYEQAVTNAECDSTMLYEYCFISFKNVETNMDLAQLFVQEASSMINLAIFERLQSFHVIIIRTLQTVIGRQYPQLDKSLQDELVFTVNALVKSHTEHMLLSKRIGPIEFICRSIDEKVRALADRITISTAAYSMQPCITVSSERLLTLIDEKITQTDDAIALESLQLLRAHIVEPNLSPAVEAGILHNLQMITSLKYVVTMYELYNSSLK